jgi:hypothetical protein
MLFSGAKKEAIAIHKRAVDKYNTLLASFNYKCEQLYVLRQLGVAQIEHIEYLINSIANTPKEFDKSISVIKNEKTKFRKTEEYAAEAYRTVLKTGVGAASGVGLGTAVASIAPTAAMWVATTFGKASTGTAISALSGAAKTKAALALLGRGALAAGGGGMAAGKALLALAGPIGWGISAGTTIFSVITMGAKNKKISEEAIEEAKKITLARAHLHETEAIVLQIYNETEVLLTNIKKQFLQASELRDSDYSSLSNEEQLLLGTLVNNTMSLSQLLNKTVG